MTDYKEYSRVHALLKLAIKRGEIRRPDACELCGNSCKHQRIEAHYWNGYDGDPLDVWWICHQCNMRMRGTKYHNGEYSKRRMAEVMRFENYNICGKDQWCKPCEKERWDSLTEEQKISELAEASRKIVF